MDEELKKYKDELSDIENAIGKIDDVLMVKEENVAGLKAQLEDLEDKRAQIEKVIEEKEKEQENQKESDDNKKDEISENEIEVDEKEVGEENEVEIFETPLPSGLRIDNLGNKDLMATVAGTNKARNNKILSNIEQQVNERKSIMPEREMEEKVAEPKAVEQKSINDDEMEK